MDLRNLALLFATAALSACSSSSPNTPTGSAGASQGDAGDSSSAGDATTAGATGSAGASAQGGGGATGSAGAPSGAPGEGGGAACTKCPNKCCDAGALCIDDGLGNLSCKKPCASSSQCPAISPCCEVLKDGSGVCAVATGDNLCRCTTGAECSTKACAPNVDTQGNPVGPYVCVLNDGAAYHGCNGALTSCKGSDCCFTDALANEFCASPCTNDSQCGAASCVTYSNANTTCSGMLGCGTK